MVGKPEIFPSDSPGGRHTAFFEDDVETGYFYALDIRRDDDRIVDADHVYNVANVVDREKPSEVDIVWSRDGSKCALLISSSTDAAFDLLGEEGTAGRTFQTSGTLKMEAG